MADSIRNLVPLIAAELVVQHNKLRADLLGLRKGTIFHADASSPALADATAVDLTTSLAMLVDLSAMWTTHIASVCSATTGQGAHIAADSTDVFTTPAGTDLATGEARANELKALFNVHIASTTYHPVADSTNTVGTADASNLATLETLCNALQTKLNAHIGAGFSSQAINLVAP